MATNVEGCNTQTKKYGKVVLTLDNVLLTPEKLAVSPSQQDGLDKEIETDLRILGCELIQTSGILLRLPQVSGIALIIVGSVIETQYRSYLDFFSSSYLSIPVLLIALGVIIFIVGFFGCCGAMKESHCMVVTFAALLIVIFVLELGVGIGAYLMRDNVSDYLKDSMIKSMKNYNKTEYSGVSRTWNVLQHEYHCCGTIGYKDWEVTLYGESINGVPRDCCKHSVEGCGNNIFRDGSDLDTIYQDGCYEPLSDFMKENITVLGGVAIGIGFVQLIGVVFSCCLARSIKRQYETV